MRPQLEELERRDCPAPLGPDLGQTLSLAQGFIGAGNLAASLLTQASQSQNPSIAGALAGLELNTLFLLSVSVGLSDTLTQIDPFILFFTPTFQQGQVAGLLFGLGRAADGLTQTAGDLSGFLQNAAPLLLSGV